MVEFGVGGDGMKDHMCLGFWGGSVWNWKILEDPCTCASTSTFYCFLFSGTYSDHVQWLRGSSMDCINKHGNRYIVTVLYWKQINTKGELTKSLTTGPPGTDIPLSIALIVPALDIGFVNQLYPFNSLEANYTLSHTTCLST